MLQREVVNIMTFAGGPRDDIVPRVDEKRLRTIVDGSWRLRKLIGVSVISSDFNLVCPHYRARFKIMLMKDDLAAKGRVVRIRRYCWRRA